MTTVFTGIGFIIALILGGCLIAAACALAAVSLGFSGTMKRPDGIAAIVMFIAGVAIIITTIYFSPFHVSVST
jgi:hypothetical protein